MPFLHVRRRDGGFSLRGQPTFEVGHRIRAGRAEPDGVFASWSWDGHRLTLENDRYGLIPIFYYSDEQQLLVSPSLATLVREGAPAEFHEDALETFHVLGWFLGEDTPFRGVKVVPPNALFEWDGRLRVEDRRPIGVATEISRDEAIDRYVALFRDSIRARLTDQEFALALTGGRDSRHILLELLEAGSRPAFCVTTRNYPPAHSEDVEIARRVTRELAVPHLYAAPRPRFEAEFRKNIATHCSVLEHAWCVAIADAFEGRVGVIYDGLGGDILSSGVHQDEERHRLLSSGSFEALATSIVGGDPRERAPHVLPLDSARSRRVILEAVTARVAAELERYGDAPNPMLMYFFWNRLRRALALSPFGVLSGIPTCFCPYLDRELFDFLASLPPQMVLDHRFHDDAIARAHPRFAHVPYADERSLPRGKSDFAGFASRVTAYGVLTDARRLGTTLRLAGAAGCYAASSSYRTRRSPPPGPRTVLHAWQLQNLRRKGL